MKKIVKIFAAALLGSLLAAPPVLAGNGSKYDKTSMAKNSVRLQLEEALTDVANTSTGTVNVYFEVSPKGKFEITDVNGANPALNRDVLNTLKSSAIFATKSIAGKYFVKIDFVNKESFASSMSATDELREKISGALSNVTTNEEGSVVITFRVKDGNFALEKVNGNPQLASAVKNTLMANSISVPADLSGCYQLEVRF